MESTTTSVTPLIRIRVSQNDGTRSSCALPFHSVLPPAVGACIKGTKDQRDTVIRIPRRLLLQELTADIIFACFIVEIRNPLAMLFQSLFFPFKLSFHLRSVVFFIISFQF
jgi:hypothetical protein